MPDLDLMKHITLVKNLHQGVPQSYGQHGVKTGNWVATRFLSCTCT